MTSERAVAKIYISADIEGTAGITLWDETENDQSRYAYFAEQMTREVAAACEGAKEGGADQILVRDAHDSACNILPDQLPEDVRLFRGGDELYNMVAGLDGSYDGVIFTGCHSGAGSISIHPKKAVRLIREAAKKAVETDAALLKLPLPKHFCVDIFHREHFDARSAACYPGVTQIEPHVTRFESDDWGEVLKLIKFLL